MVNSLHKRNLEKSEVVAILKLMWPRRDEWVVASRSFLSISQVMGSLGLHSFSSMYLLML